VQSTVVTYSGVPFSKHSTSTGIETQGCTNEKVPGAAVEYRRLQRGLWSSSSKKLYIDLSFFRDLHTHFGAPGDSAQAYVIAHEVGHHVR
jgi:hypothetical protein